MPTEDTVENLPAKTARLRFTAVERGGRRPKGGEIEKGKILERDSMWMLGFKVPTTCTDVGGVRNGRTMAAPKRGLSAMDWPTCRLWRTTGSFKDER